MKLYFILSEFVSLAALSSAEYSHKETGSVYSDTTLKCPVTGDEITGEHVSYRYIDKDVKFCNDDCKLAFNKEPVKYSEHLFRMPWNDPDANNDINTVNNGVKYYFCNNGCKGKFEAAPEVYPEKFKK